MLLSTRELLYFESENSAKRKGTVDLKMASEVNALPDDFSNYEEAFEVVTGKRRWIMCPESRNQKIMWVEALEPMIGGADVDGSGGGGRAVYNTRNSTTSMATASKCISVLQTPTFAALQLASFAGSEGGWRFPAALHAGRGAMQPCSLL